MRNPSDEEIAGVLVGIIADGFNRSMNALDHAGAIDRAGMAKGYSGVGTPLYDMVTQEMQYTARFGAQAIRKLFSGTES